LLAKLETLIVSDILPIETNKPRNYLCRVALPPKKRRHGFTNCKWPRQKFMKAIRNRAGDCSARRNGNFLHKTAFSMSPARMAFVSIEGLFNLMAREVRFL